MNSHFPAGARLAVLDTNALRAMGHDAPWWVGTLERMAREGFCFTISDLAFAEFGYQFTSRRFDRDVFDLAIEQAEKFIFSRGADSAVESRYHFRDRSERFRARFLTLRSAGLDQCALPVH